MVSCPRRCLPAGSLYRRPAGVAAGPSVRPAGPGPAASAGLLGKGGGPRPRRGQGRRLGGFGVCEGGEMGNSGFILVFFGGGLGWMGGRARSARGGRCSAGSQAVGQRSAPACRDTIEMPPVKAN